LYSGGKEAIASYGARVEVLTDDLNWMKNLPLYVEPEHFMISHAGICEHTDAFDPISHNGLVWNKRNLANLGKVQFHGHKPHKTQGPAFTESSNSWNLDTACVFGNGLCGVHLSETGEIMEVNFVPTQPKDRA
jgi:serine/threonine protein phosphatase 1